MDAFCEQLAREIIGDVKNELKTRKDQNESPSSIPVPSNYALLRIYMKTKYERFSQRKKP